MGLLASGSSSTHCRSGSRRGPWRGSGRFGEGEKTVSAHLQANVPQLSSFSDLLGNELKGAASLTAAVTGTQDRPALALNLSANEVGVATSGAQHLDANISAAPTGPVDDPDTRIEFAAKGRVEGLIVPEGVTVPLELGRDIDW